MSDLLHDADLQTQRAPKTKPPTRWRNRWRYCARVDVEYNGTIWTNGKEAWSGECYPSKDIAHTAAMREMGDGEVRAFEYLGAFPCDENGEPLP